MKQAPGSAILEVLGLAYGYSAETLQHDVSFDVKRGSIFAIMGASGSGKSTLLKVLIGLQRPSAGEIAFGGVSYCSLGDAERAEIGRHFGVLFQGGALWSSMTAAENVALPLQMFTELDRPSIEALVQLKLTLVGLDTGRDRMPSDLSGGMRQRVGLARALALDPEILFLDEPSTGLDPISARHFDDLVKGVRDGFGVTVDHGEPRAAEPVRHLRRRRVPGCRNAYGNSPRRTACSARRVHASHGASLHASRSDRRAFRDARPFAKRGCS